MAEYFPERYTFIVSFNFYLLQVCKKLIRNMFSFLFT